MEQAKPLTTSKIRKRRRGGGNPYAFPIATYALAEAYGMSRNPDIRCAAEKDESYVRVTVYS